MCQKKKKIKVYILSPNNNSGTKTIPNIIIWLNGPNKELQVPAMNEEVIKVFFPYEWWCLVCSQNMLD